MTRFAPGERVRVRAGESAGHVRTPWYVKGRAGRVERCHGAFRNPETLAYGGDGLPEQPLYLVGFAQRELWPGYDGPPRDTLYLDLYEHWLEEDT